MQDMRRRSVVSAFVFLLFAIGCSGSKQQDVLGSSSGSGTSGSSTSSSSGGTSGTSSSSGTTSGSSSGGGADSGAPCDEEHEPNDDPSQANTLVSSTCGALSPTSETDYLTFTLTPNTKTMNLTFDGDIKIRITVQGKQVDVTPTSNTSIPFVTGHPYLLQIQAYQEATQIPWRVNLARTF